MQAAAFEPLVGDAFTVAAADGVEAELRLESVSGLPAQSRVDAAGTPVLDGFSLLFTGSPEYPLPQGIYTVEHGRLGTHEWFVVPVVSPDARVRAYEVLFSWLVEQAPAAAPESQA